jgi:peptidoglycan/LPS O-acetylase OafA/YrhL
MFFILSGFILVYTYAGRDWKVKDFWRARFARIYPAYLFSLLVTAPGFFYVCLAMKEAEIPAFYVWFKHHLLLSVSLVPVLLQSWVPNAGLAWNAPAWSLSDEAFFYAVFPLIVAWLIRACQRRLALGALALWFVSLGLATAYVLLKPDGVAHVDDQSLTLTWLNALKFHPLARLPEFITGACLGFLFLRKSVDRKWATAMIGAGVLMLAVVAALAPRIPYPILHGSLLVPAFAAIIYGFALRPNWSAVLEFKPLVLLGDASYSLYLLHSMIVWIYFNPIPGQMRHTSPLGIVGGIAVAVVISILVYLLIEQPARRWLRAKPKVQAETAPVAAFRCARCRWWTTRPACAA